MSTRTCPKCGSPTTLDEPCSSCSLRMILEEDLKEHDYVLSETDDGYCIDRYRVEHVIGTGGMGTVFRGFDTKMERLVALKVIRKDLASDSAMKERFLREVRAFATLGHANIIAIHDVGEWREHPYFCMEYIEGRSLADLIAAEAPLQKDRILPVVIQLAEALERVHSRGYIHRDIKPANILLNNCVEAVKLGDFGIAIADDEELRLTHPGAGVGTPPYMSPEQFQGNAHPASDLYSVGVVLYQMMTGQLPFRADNLSSLIASVLQDIPKPVLSLNPQADPQLVKLVDGLLTKDHRKRKPQDASELADILRRIAANEHQKIPIRSDPTPVPKTLLKLIGVAAACLCIGAWFWFVPRGTGQPLSAIQASFLDIPSDPVTIRNARKQWGQKLQVPESFVDASGIEFVLIPPGKFQMGISTPPAELEAETGYQGLARLAEKSYPPVNAKVTRAFYMGVHEVTVGQFKAIMDGYLTTSETVGPDGTKAGSEGIRHGSVFVNAEEFNWKNPGFAQDHTHPVVSITISDAKEFCRRLSVSQSKPKFVSTYRLPTRSEWEFTARAAMNRKVDLSELSEMGNFLDRISAAIFTQMGEPAVPGNDGFRFTAPVGSFPPNAFGVYDILGNACEWAPEVSGHAWTIGGGFTTRRGVAGEPGIADLISPRNRSCAQGFRIVCEIDAHD